jgi:tetratricopeptide (TPR) repeat protein
MQMYRDPSKQDRHSAQQSFVVGERSLRAYFAGGNVRFLQDAEANFSQLNPNDERYDDARFFLGITKTQLRKSKESIDILEELRKRREAGDQTAHAGLENKIALQLAYAHIKTYTDEGYQAAEKELQRFVMSAEGIGDWDLLLQAQSIQVFLYSVMAGRSKLKELRPGFAREALALGGKLLETNRSSLGVRFEAFNALGITWMRIAEANWDGFAERTVSWERSQSYYEQAMMIVPNSVRVLQNMARLRLIQVEQAFPKEPSALLAEAKELVVRSLEVNDQDQYPYYELAKIAIEQKDPEAAWSYIRTGRSRPGAVKEKEWIQVESAAEALRAGAR